MFSHQFYNVVHIVGLALLMAGLGGMSAISDTTSQALRVRRALGAFYGLGIFLILLGGFGMLARLGIVRGTTWPGWVWAKVGIWGALAALAFLVKRFPRASVSLMLLLPVLGGIAAYMAIYKPL